VIEWILTHVDSKAQKPETWQRHQNEVRPHSSLGQQTRAVFSKSCGIAAKPAAIF
jgi:hypothetical protein